MLLIFGLLGVALARWWAPIIEELAAEFEGQVIIGKCDVDENGDMAAEYGIRNIPTVLFFKNGEISRQTGRCSWQTGIRRKGEEAFIVDNT